jgi:hypothetical protein
LQAIFYKPQEHVCGYRHINACKQIQSGIFSSGLKKFKQGVVFEQIHGKWVAGIVNNYKSVLRIHARTDEWRNLNLDALLTVFTVSKERAVQLQKLQLFENATEEDVHAAIHNAKLKAHPDKGGSSDAWQKLQRTITFFDAEKKKQVSIFLMVQFHE